MKRKLMPSCTALFLTIFSATVFAADFVFPANATLQNAAACAAAPNHAASNFCDQDIQGSGYRAVVYCYCHSKVPLPSCSDMTWVYNAMIGRYGTLEKGCENNPAGTDAHECMNQWSCYMTGKPAFDNDPPCADPKPLCA